ncbi:MAG: hydrogenase iron-sulfur subunit [Spirochaetales bacterium]|nr:hydrogenase iron-sulfur subunit [Spirochaetales bacterium]
MTKNMMIIHCPEGAGKALKNMAHHGFRLPETVDFLELPCTGRVNDALLAETLKTGFDGVLVIGCRKENCKFVTGNLRAEKRIARLARILEEAGVSGKQLAMEFIAPDEGRRLYKIINGFYKKLSGENTEKQS